MTQLYPLEPLSLIRREGVLHLLEGTGASGPSHARMRIEIRVSKMAPVADVLAEQTRMLELCHRVGSFLSPDPRVFVDRPLLMSDAATEEIVVVGGLRTSSTDRRLPGRMHTVVLRVFEPEGYRLWGAK